MILRTDTITSGDQFKRIRCDSSKELCRLLSPIEKDVEPILASQILVNVEFWSGGVTGWGSRTNA